jgi:hypothetical protein
LSAGRCPAPMRYRRCHPRPVRQPRPSHYQMGPTCHLVPPVSGIGLSLFSLASRGTVPPRFVPCPTDPTCHLVPLWHCATAVTSTPHPSCTHVGDEVYNLHPPRASNPSTFPFTSTQARVFFLPPLPPLSVHHCPAISVAPRFDQGLKQMCATA